MRTIRKDAEYILEAKRHYSNSRLIFLGEATSLTYNLRTYAVHKAETDPVFFNWLFDDKDISAFGANLTKERKDEYNAWLMTLDVNFSQ